MGIRNPFSSGCSLNNNCTSMGTGLESELKESEFEPFKADFESKEQFLQVLEEHRLETVDVHVDDVINMVAELRGVNRSSIMQTAVTAWSYHALGFRVIEAECHEQLR